jgi:hypothetical protein
MNRAAFYLVPLLFALPIAIADCVPSYAPPSAAELAELQADANAQTDAAMMSRLESARAAAKNAPGSPREAAAFASELKNAILAGTFERKKLGPDIVDEAVLRLDEASAARAEEAPELLAVKGELLLNAKRTEAGLAALDESLAKRPNLRAFLLLGEHLGKTGKSADVVALCQKVRPVATTDSERYDVLDACLSFAHASSIEGGLSWTTSEDIAFYKVERQKRDAEADRKNAEHRAEQKQEQEAMVKQFEESQRKADQEKACVRQCDSVESICQSNCGGESMCRATCEGDARHCRSSCP